MLTETSISPQEPRRLLEARALAGLAFFADGLADALQLARHLLVGGDDVVEGVGDLAFKAGPGDGQPDGEVAFRMVCRLARISARSSLNG